MEQRINADGRGLKKFGKRGEVTKFTLLVSVLICVFPLFLLSSCSSKSTDLRTLAPADTLVYLETNDLAAALQPIIDSKPFNEVAKKKPDLSALKGVQLAAAVTGFETSEEKLTDEHSVGRVQPHFVAIADTHAFHYQAVGFAEKKLGAFVENIYDSPPTLEKSDKNGGKYFTWTAKDGRKAYALVIDSLIYFGNDESAIDKCLGVRRSEAYSIVKTGKVPPTDPATLASGYVSTDGIAQIANIVGLKFASEAGEDSEVQSAIAGILPQLLRNSITEISWTSTKTEQGIEDKYIVSMPPDVASVLNETMAPNREAPELFLSDLQHIQSVTRYKLRSPQVAWRSLLLVLQNKSNSFAAKMLAELSGVVFEPYGIRDAEMFLNSVDPNIITAKTGLEGEYPFVVATMRDIPQAQKSLVAGLKPHSPAYWHDDENDLSAVFRGNRIIIGSAHGLAIVTDHGNVPRDPPSDDLLTKLAESKAPITTWGTENSSASQIAEMLSEKSDAKADSTYYTETRFTRTGIERRTVSDFGLIGSIIAQLGQD